MNNITSSNKLSVGTNLPYNSPKIIHMRIMVGVIALFFISSTGSSQKGKEYDSKDLTALEMLVSKWEQYWNSHNMDSMGTLLREDVDFVNVAGVWLKGKTSAVADHKQKHQTIFRSSVWTTDSIHVKYVKPDVAVLHISWGLRGDFDPDGTPREPRNGIFTWVATKKNRQWQLLAVHNVNKRVTVSPSKQ